MVVVFDCNACVPNKRCTLDKFLVFEMDCMFLVVEMENSFDHSLSF